MKIVITGSRGYIGSYLCKRAKEDGHEVVGIDRRNGHKENLKYHTTVFEQAAKIKWANLLIHMAGKAAVENDAEGYPNNVVMAVHAAKLSQMIDARVFFASTCAVTANQDNFYTRSKKDMESSVEGWLRDGKRGTIWRLGTVFGESPGPYKPTVVNNMIRDAIQAKKIVYVENTQRPLLWLEDLYQLLVPRSEGQKREVIQYAATGSWYLSTLASTIASLLPFDISIYSIPQVSLSYGAMLTTGDLKGKLKIEIDKALEKADESVVRGIRSHD